MPAKKAPRPPKSATPVRIEFAWAPDPVVDPRNGKLEHPLVVYALDAGAVLGIRLAFEKDLKRSRRAR